jgi:Putative addiction module component
MLKDSIAHRNGLLPLAVWLSRTAKDATIGGRFRGGQAYNGEIVSTEDLEIELLKLPASDRARLAEKLLESLEHLSDEENARLWAEEAKRRDQAWDANLTMGRRSDEVFSDARARLK